MIEKWLSIIKHPTAKQYVVAIHHKDYEGHTYPAKLLEIFGNLEETMNYTLAAGQGNELQIKPYEDTDV